MNDPFNLQRFLDAQSRDYEQALQEIRNGQKQSHWVWYIFPQLKGFGRTYESEYYGISRLEEARAYYNHPVLGSRLVEITNALLEHSDKSAQEIFSRTDARKVKSCMTLFWVASSNPLFKSVIDTFYGGRMDNKTISKTGGSPSSPTINSSKTTNMNYHHNLFKVDHLDFLIVDQALRGNGYRMSEDDKRVIGLYNFFGRWFSKRFIADRINYIDETSRKEGKHIPSFIEADDYFRNAFQELHELFSKMRNEEVNDKTRYIDINSEILTEINNLCHFNDTYKVKALLKYIIPDWLSGSAIYLRSMAMNLVHDNECHYKIKRLTKEMILFWWEEEKVPHAICYVSTNENANFGEAFSIDYSETKDNDCDPDELGWYYFIDKSTNLPNALNYSGSQYVPVFRMDGTNIISCNPPLIRHDYHLKPLRIPGNDFVFSRNSDIFDKYYDLYHTGNWNAKHAIERGGFNLNG